MAKFEDLKQRLRETAEVIGDVSIDLYKRAEEKTKILAKKAKLQAEIASDKTAVKKLYQEIGKTYYESHKLYPEPELEQNCADVTAALERIALRYEELAELRSTGDSSDGATDAETSVWDEGEDGAEAETDAPEDKSDI